MKKETLNESRYIQNETIVYDARSMESFSQLAQWLEVQGNGKIRKRLHLWIKKSCIEDLWNDDKARLKPLPLERPNGLLIGTQQRCK